MNFNKKYILIFFLFLVSASLSLSNSNLSWQQLKNLPDHSIIILAVPAKTLTVEIVNTEASRNQGLSHRNKIGQEGMLFVFPEPQHAFFWMKDMKFNLDLIWIRAHKVVAIMKNLPHPFNSAEKLAIYSIKQPIDAVLEIPAGKAQTWDIKQGTQLFLQGYR